MLTRKLLLVLTLLSIPLFSCACQENNTTLIPMTLEAPPPATPTTTPTPRPDPALISVPQGKPPTIDGTLSPGEWDDAATDTFADGSELFLIYSDGYLYLGIRSSTSEMIVGNIFVDRGDEIAILHTSAALGTAIYAKGSEGWEQTQGFVWRCRKIGNDEAALAERDAFFEGDHWVAANSRTGTPNELEYRIEATGKILRLAANILRSSNPNEKIPWPADLDDDCITPTPGGLPDALHFSPEKWATVGLPCSEE